MRKDYPWKRFWVREGTDLFLLGNAYLPNPAQKHSSWLNVGVFSLAQISDETCKILLGEAGMGKSRSIRNEITERRLLAQHDQQTDVLIDLGSVTSFTDLRNLMFENAAIRTWRDKQGVLALFLDSIDEAIAQYPGLPKALLEVLNEFPPSLIRLSIVCRSGEFPDYLDEGLTSWHGNEPVSRWHIAPLTREDVGIAATQNGRDADKFLKAIENHELEPLAARPITLELLLAADSSGSGMTADIWSLYERGCRQMLSEQPDSSRFSRPERLDLDQQMLIAGRIACISIFGGYSAIDATPNILASDSTVSVSEIAGGQERCNGSSFSVGTQEVQEVLKSGLFSADGLRFRWAHKSYAEFLAAMHLKAHAVATRQIMNLFCRMGRIVPGLRGVVAWVASRDELVFREVLKIDPDVLLFGDLSMAPAELKGELVDWLLAQGDWDRGSLTTPALPHHRTCGSASGGSAS